MSTWSEIARPHEDIRRGDFDEAVFASSNLADLSRGVFIPLSREVGEFTFTIEIDVKSAEGIPRKVIEQQVHETLRQLGASIQGLA